MSGRLQAESPVQPRRQLQSGGHVISEYSQGFGPKQSEETPDSSNLDFLFSNDVVSYKCSCDQYQKLSATYFCRHCIALRCRSCVAREVDSQYCQRCLEYIPTIDPNFQKNKCANCYMCPCCQHLLSASILPVSPQAAEQAQQLHQQQQASQQSGTQQVQPQTQQEDVTQRTCQLVCEFCRWSSEMFTTIGSKQTSSPFEFKDPHADKIEELMSYYKITSKKERAEKKKRRFQTRSGNTMDLLKKYGIDNTLSPKLFESLRARTTLDGKSVTKKYQVEAKNDEDNVIDTFKASPALATEELQPLDVDFYYSKNFDIGAMSSIEQRLAQVELQPDKVVDFKPISKFLSVKNSLRCKQCERNLCRSEYSPVSIRFKIQSAAFYHIPELKLKTDVYPIKLILNQDNIIEMTLQNQTIFPVKTKVLKIDKQSDNPEVFKGDSSLQQVPSDNLLAEQAKETYHISLPPAELSLGPKDDTTDYEHVPFTLRPLNEETQITFQSPFKVGFFVKVKPLIKMDNLNISFSLTHDIQVLQSTKEAEKETLASHVVNIRLGPVT